ncbi:hypothetical protein Nepgr_028911 [Nepenthes gracilis]|uniref:Uncharacterized protein n=1 Tax=Nepenthes gracilis TaxID=150966 RepID=A0AAD3TD55_NEPGR|nr:hypothetical protein Nepgr_028911 [Nepenthes gracilis]
MNGNAYTSTLFVATSAAAVSSLSSVNRVSQREGEYVVRCYARRFAILGRYESSDPAAAGAFGWLYVRVRSMFFDGIVVVLSESGECRDWSLARIDSLLHISFADAKLHSAPFVDDAICWSGLQSAFVISLETNLPTVVGGCSLCLVVESVCCRCCFRCVHSLALGWSVAQVFLSLWFFHLNYILIFGCSFLWNCALNTGGSFDAYPVDSSFGFGPCSLFERDGFLANEGFRLLVVIPKNGFSRFGWGGFPV